MTDPSTNSARFAARPIAEGGTPVAAWTQWQRRFPELDVDDCPALVLVAAHPDDETLGLGATAAVLSDRGVTVQVVALTDGEAAYPDDGDGRKRLAKLRRDELAAATERLGLPRPIFLRIPDGEAASSGSAPESGPCSPASAAGRGARRRGAATATPTTRLRGGRPRPHARPPARRWSSTQYGCGTATPDVPAVPWHRARRVPLTSGEMAIKMAAMECFASQLDRGEGPPLLTPEVVDRQMTVGEIVFV